MRVILRPGVNTECDSKEAGQVEGLDGYQKKNDERLYNAADGGNVVDAINRLNQRVKDNKGDIREIRETVTEQLRDVVDNMTNTSVVSSDGSVSVEFDEETKTYDISVEERLYDGTLPVLSSRQGKTNVNDFNSSVSSYIVTKVDDEDDRIVFDATVDELCDAMSKSVSLLISDDYPSGLSIMTSDGTSVGQTTVALQKGSIVNVSWFDGDDGLVFDVKKPRISSSDRSLSVNVMSDGRVDAKISVESDDNTIDVYRGTKKDGYYRLRKSRDVSMTINRNNFNLYLNGQTSNGKVYQQVWNYDEEKYERKLVDFVPPSGYDPDDPHKFPAPLQPYNINGDLVVPSNIEHIHINRGRYFNEFFMSFKNIKMYDTPYKWVFNGSKYTEPTLEQQEEMVDGLRPKDFWNGKMITISGYVQLVDPSLLYWSEMDEGGFGLMETACYNKLYSIPDGKKFSERWNTVDNYAIMKEAVNFEYPYVTFVHWNGKWFMSNTVRDVDYSFIQQMISDAQLSGSGVDLSNYFTKSQVLEQIQNYHNANSGNGTDSRLTDDMLAYLNGKLQYRYSYTIGMSASPSSISWPDIPSSVTFTATSQASKSNDGGSRTVAITSAIANTSGWNSTGTAGQFTRTVNVDKTATQVSSGNISVYVTTAENSGTAGPSSKSVQIKKPWFIIQNQEDFLNKSSVIESYISRSNEARLSGVNSVNGVQTVVLHTGGYMWFAIPNTMSLSYAKQLGNSILSENVLTVQTSLGEYKLYRSGQGLTPGTFEIDIKIS